MPDMFSEKTVLPDWIKNNIRDGFVMRDFPDKPPKAIAIEGDAYKPWYDCYISHSEYTNMVNAPHYHGLVSAWYVKSGWADHHLSGKCYRQDEHTVIFVPPNIEHFIDLRKTPAHSSYHLLINIPFFNSPENRSLRDDVFSMLFIDALDPNRNPVIEFRGEAAVRADAMIDKMMSLCDYDDKIIQPAMRAECVSFIALAMREYACSNISELAAKYRSGIASALDYISENCCSKLHIDDVCKISMMSRRLFTYVFRNVMGISFASFLNLQRMIRARELLRNTDRTILDISEACGFADDSAFRQAFKRIVGCQPAVYRRNCRNSSKQIL